MQDHAPYDYVRSLWVADIESCYALDSCNGGLGASGGGCYKWADSADGEAYPWPGEEGAVHVLATYSYLDISADAWLWPGDEFVFYDDDQGDLAECILDRSGALVAHNHDALSGDGPGTFSDPVTSGCAVAEEAGYQVRCCFEEGL